MSDRCRRTVAPRGTVIRACVDCPSARYTSATRRDGRVAAVRRGARIDVHICLSSR